MCLSQIWTYRECGCHYHHLAPCHPSFTPTLTVPRRLKADTHLSNASSPSERSPASTEGSTFSNNDLFPALGRQCSIRHIVHKAFLEPICDDCLLEELGLQPELGPILGGRDLKEGLQGEDWLLESSVEIKVEEPNESKDPSIDYARDDEEAADADDEGEFRGRSGRRRGMDISRDSLRISSDLSADEREGLALFRDGLRGTESEGRKWARAAIKAQKERRRLTPYWPQQLRKSVPKKSVNEKTSLSISPGDNGSVSSSRSDIWTPPLLDQELTGETSRCEDAQLPSDTPLWEGRDTSSDTRDEIISLYQINEQHNHQEPEDVSWSQHLRADLDERHTIQNHPAPSLVDHDAFQRRPQSPPPIPSSPQTATPFSSASWPPPNLQLLNIPSSEFEKDDIVTPPDPSPTQPTPSLPKNHTHTISIDSTLSVSTFCTAHSSPSSPCQRTATPSTRPSTATSTTQLSLHPLSTALAISTPHRPRLTPRTSSLRSPPASSLLLHSTPPLHQSPTSAFVCVHERWAFQKCGCAGPSLVQSCVCDNGNNVTPGYGNQTDEDANEDRCRAADPLVRTRWFFNPTCEACLEREDPAQDTQRSSEVDGAAPRQ